ncbi:MAG: hypothetical protein KDA85_07905 [Planctomycetaceae bacterium]|nr:hypothetical protein [Planctomycetaceae bacterium]
MIESEADSFSSLEQQLRMLRPTNAELFPAQLYYRAGWDAALAALAGQSPETAARFSPASTIHGRAAKTNHAVSMQASARQSPPAQTGPRGTTRGFVTGLATGMISVMGLLLLFSGQHFSFQGNGPGKSGEKLAATSHPTTSDRQTSFLPLPADSSSSGRAEKGDETTVTSATDRSADRDWRLAAGQMLQTAAGFESLSPAAQLQWESAGLSGTEHVSAEPPKNSGLDPRSHDLILRPAPLTEELLRELL